jgi:hypothetical protein
VTHFALDALLGVRGRIALRVLGEGESVKSKEEGQEDEFAHKFSLERKPK